MTEPLDEPLDKEPFDTVIVGGSVPAPSRPA
jgi:hypothetical protein